MATQTLSVQLSSQAVGATSSYWLTLKQQEEEGDRVSLEEAADFIDSLYDTEPCEQDQEGGEEAREPVAEDDYLLFAKDLMALSATCEAQDGSWSCTVMVARSHQSEPYRLVLDNGTAGEARQVQERVSRTLAPDNESSMTLDVPVLGNFTCQWEGPVYGATGSIAPPEVTVLGSTVNFGRVVTGALRCHFDTVYDLVDCEIDALPAAPGAQGSKEPAPCRALAFYHGLVEELELEPPEPDEEADADKYCPDEHLDPTPDNVTCYEIVRRVTRCRCSDDEASVDPVESVVDCPKGYDCPGGVETCRQLMGTRTITVGYGACSGEEYEEGDVGDPQFFLDTCCESPWANLETDLPPCRTIRSEYKGGKGLSAEVKALYPGATFVAVGPRDGMCGTVTRTWNVVPRNCCDFIEPMAWDEENCADIAPGMVMVTGGTGRYTWKLHGGVGFSFAADIVQVQKITGVPYVRVYRTGSDCGSVGIEVEDGCSELQRIMLSPNGRWIRIDAVITGDEKPESVTSCFWRPYNECLMADGTPSDPTRPDCWASSKYSEYKDQYKWNGDPAIGTYWCAPCGMAEVFATELTSGIKRTTFKVNVGNEDGDTGSCKTCSYNLTYLYEWVC